MNKGVATLSVILHPYLKELTNSASSDKLKTIKNQEHILQNVNKVFRSGEPKSIIYALQKIWFCIILHVIIRIFVNYTYHIEARNGNQLTIAN